MTCTPQPLDPQAQKLPPHPYAALFPRLEPSELREMAKDIAGRGLLEPICVYQGMVLDGLNRQDACFLAQVAPVYQEFAGDDPLGFVCAKNFRRRQLTQAQKALVAARL
ncbi:MAG: S-adenosylmethionine-binding protein, partial [Gemmataceae bacterium]